LGDVGVIGIVLQARLGSTRLPGKVLMPMAGRTLLGHNIDRLRRVRRADRLVVAIPDDEANDVLAACCEREAVTYFRGSESDVLGRYYACARELEMDQVVRATADCPLVDPFETDRLIELHLAAGADYSSSKDEVGCRLPNGTGLEIFSLDALAKSNELGRAPYHREHINEYVVENPQSFRIESLTEPPAKCCPDLDLTVDTAEDFAFVDQIIEHFAGDHDRMTTEAIIAHCSVNA
jgi:spore coat polysaccharide biosynthesis protein SpsF